jgi:hypothetical protein
MRQVNKPMPPQNILSVFLFCPYFPYFDAKILLFSQFLMTLLQRQDTVETLTDPIQ